MSIPPLVCSTPPPPDQCEDDKDPEDFDLPYNLSQEEEENSDYQYGAYSEYSMYPSTSDKIEHVKWPLGFDETNEIEIKDEQNIENDECSNTPQTSDLNDTNIKSDYIIIEDLNLKINDSPDDSPGSVHSIYNSDMESNNRTDSHNVTMIDTEDTKNGNIVTSILHVEPMPTISDEKCTITAENLSKNLQDDEISDPASIPEASYHSDEIQNHTLNEFEKIDELSQSINKNNIADDNTDDEFADFEDFQCSTNANTEILLENSLNPWQDKHSENETDDFEANFDDEIMNKFDTSIDIQEKTQTVKEPQDSELKLQDDFNDDFGDFESSTIKEVSQSPVSDTLPPSQHVSVLNLNSQDNEVQIVDSITNVLNSIFDQKLTEPENNIETRLETLLSETWRHIIDMDVRQPYIVNWNNSLGQKSLLKALCIDSRNILFGPKWNYNMPKYAANLSNAPLQPQKQATPLNSAQGEVQNVEKAASSKQESGSWTDPFTSDGSQESCSSEDNSTGAAAKPTELDVFENQTITKPEKIYSSSINVQPIRQINLPDTHIFTPTDSEIPRSKTIHYDNGPTVIVPTAIEETEKIKTEHLSSQPNPPVNDGLENDSEYWQFQDFKGAVENKTFESETESKSSVDKNNERHTGGNENGTLASTSTNVTYSSQVLQPIKVEPIMPTLNWPDPGEVKETFEDFTEFVSSTSWKNDKQELTVSREIGIENTSMVVKDIQQSPATNPENVDDEFETFQSAPAIQTSSIDHIGSVITQALPQPPVNAIELSRDNINPKIQNDMFTQNHGPKTASNLNYLQSKDVLIPSPVAMSNSPSMSNHVIQPTPSSITRNQQQSGQILQPLSLESYSQINWPNPGIDLQDLSRFNPVESLQSLKSDFSVSGHSKVTSPVHTANEASTAQKEVLDDDIWGEFVSSKPKQAQPSKNPQVFNDDDEWTDFVSSPGVKTQNGLNTISLNVHTNSNLQKTSHLNKFGTKNNQKPLDIPTLTYITPKSSGRGAYIDKHFQNL